MAHPKSWNKKKTEIRGREKEGKEDSLKFDKFDTKNFILTNFCLYTLLTVSDNEYYFLKKQFRQIKHFLLRLTKSSQNTKKKTAIS